MDRTGSADDGRSVPLDRYPDPAVSYTIDSGEPTIEATNEAFESAFGAADSDTPVRELLEQFRHSLPERVDSFTDLLTGTGPNTVAVQTEDAAYLVRILPPADDAFGYVVFNGRVEGGTLPGSSNVPGAGRPEKANGEPSSGFDIDRVASVLSHDLRNPLDVAKARLQAGRETGEDEHFEHVEKAHRRMERIIEDVLTLSRGREHITPENTVELGAVVKSAWETVETGAATLTIADDLPTTEADRDRIERLFENLFRNAVEHGSTSLRSNAREDAVEHGDHPEITVGRLTGDGNGFYVADDGPGIPPEEQAAVFDPGYSSHEHGTGLGLSIVKRIAECHEWTVEAKNGRSGARFEFRGIEWEG